MVDISIPLVSIVINDFNYARYLPQSIESALSQTHPRTEIVVVDDASTDDSRQVIEQYASRVVPIFQELNGGQAAAINSGFRASHGEIVIFLDADDYLYPHAAERVVAAWTPGASKVQYRLDLVDAEGRKLDVYPPPDVLFDSGDVVPRLLSRGRYETTVTSGNAFARDTLAKILPVPEDDFRISADGYLVTVSPFHGPVQSIEEPLGAYRQHGGNAWAMASAETITSALGARLRRSLQHDARRQRALEAKARELGLAVSPRAWMSDHQHLEARLASLRLDRDSHPYPDDTRAALALRGMMASWAARARWKRRTILAAWFLAVGVLPGPLAARAVAWRLAQSSRPPAVDWFLKAFRRILLR